jgi:hypothetical protein
MNDRATENNERRLERAAGLRAAQTSNRAPHEEAEPGAVTADVDARQNRRKISDAQRADYLIRDAMARGEFDNLKYAGKPIPDLGESTDPDWWIKGLIRRENLSGLGPPAILLRKEDAELDSVLDGRYSEQQVREVVESFNKRVIDARRQLQGGPPVITKTRDVDHEVDRWHERRAAAAAARAPEPEPEARRPWWRRPWSPRGPN